MHTILLCCALTLDQAIAIFRASAFDILIARANVDSARADEQIASALPNPSIGASRGSFAALSASFTDSAISDVASGRRRLRAEVARAATAITAATRNDVERNLEFTLKQQLLAAELAKRELEFARESDSLSSQTFELISARYKAGAVSEADVARADVQRLEAEQAVDTATQTLHVAQSQLAFLLARSETIDVS